MTRRLRLACCAALAFAAAPALADVVRANSTTLFYTREDPYAGDLDRAAPLFQLISITATEVSTGLAEEVEIALSTWGALDIGDVRRWQNGPMTSKRLTGDVDVGYIKGEVFDRRMILRLGRFMVPEGNARMVHLDGGETRLRLPYGFGLSGYVGSPVASRFAARGGELTIGNERANLSTGGRASWFYPGLLEAGASVAFARDRGDVARQDVGADLRLFLPADLQLVAVGFYSVVEERLGEADVSASWRARRELQLTGNYRHVEPDLFLPRTSILSVFADDERDEVGGAVRLEPARGLTFDANYHTLFEPAGTGHRARLKGIWRPRSTSDLGGETVYLTGPDDGGYWLARAFAAWRRSALELTGDLMTVFLQRDVNGEDFDLSGTVTAGYRFARGWKALVAGTAGTSPFLESHFDVLAKLVYDQTYVTREVP
jgi:hypothetical protein